MKSKNKYENTNDKKISIIDLSAKKERVENILGKILTEKSF